MGIDRLGKEKLYDVKDYKGITGEIDRYINEEGEEIVVTKKGFAIYQNKLSDIEAGVEYKKKPRNNNIDWQDLIIDYCYGYLDENGNHHLPTFKELAEKYDVSYWTIKTKARDADVSWQVKRELAQEEIKSTLDYQKKGARLANLTEEASKKIQVMNDVVDYFQDIMTNAKHDPENYKLSVMDCVGMVNAMDKMYKLRADILGQPKTAKEKMEIKKEEAKKEEKRAFSTSAKDIEAELRELTKDILNIEELIAD